jgi:hypothetical protein
MPAFYKIDKDHGIVMTTASGVLTLADGLAHQEKILNDPEFDPSFSQLLDFTQVTRIELRSEDVRTLARRSIFSPDSRRAILVRDSLAYGMARMFESYRENFGEKGIRIFHSLDDALAWLLAKNAST